MANVETASAPAAPAVVTSETGGSVPLLISLTSTTSDQLELTLQHLGEALGGFPATVLSPDVDEASIQTRSGLSILPFSGVRGTRGSWVLNAQDFLNINRQVQSHGAQAVLLLGPEAHTLEPEALRRLADLLLVDKVDLGTPDYVLGPQQGLVNSAMLYPITRALFGTSSRFPLALDLAISPRMADRLAGAAARLASSSDGPALLWPVAEAAGAGFRVGSAPGGRRTLPTPDTADLNALLAQVAGSFFADVEAKAAFWQRSRPTGSFTGSAFTASPTHEPDDIQALLESFRVAYTNLSEIWSLVLPPQSLLGLKRLAVQPDTDFRMPASLWARVVYDFILAFRLRTLNRGHLLGALTPLYLAWVASHLLILNQGGSPEQHVQETARAFEAEKPYFVSRWRWPDRFNP